MVAQWTPETVTLGPYLRHVLGRHRDAGRQLRNLQCGGSRLVRSPLRGLLFPADLCDQRRQRIARLLDLTTVYLGQPGQRMRVTGQRCEPSESSLDAASHTVKIAPRRLAAGGGLGSARRRPLAVRGHDRTSVVVGT